MKTVSIHLTEAELRLLCLYWPGDIDSMGNADAEDPQHPVQPTGRRIMDKLNKATAIVEFRRSL